MKRDSLLGFRLPALGLCAVVLSALCVYLLFSLRAERERRRAVTSELAQLSAEMETLQSEREQLERELRSRRRTASASRRGEEEGLAPAPQASAPSMNVAPVARPPGMEAPAAVRELGAMHTYGELARELGLSPAQTKQLMKLLAEHEDSELNAGTWATADPAALESARQERERGKEQAIAQALGQETAARYRSYRESLSERMELRRIAERLDVFGTPIAGEQKSKLLAILSEESDRTPRPPVRQESVAQDIALVKQWEEDKRRRISERATTVLNPEQRAQLDDYYAMQESLLSMRTTAPAPDEDD